MASLQVDFKTPLKEIPVTELKKTQDSADYAGGFGDVWKCTWYTSSKEPPLTVAIKAVRVTDRSQTELLAKTARGIRREAYVWANLKDDHILSLHGITSGFGVLPAFISSWMTKGSLDNYLKQKPTLLISRKLDMSHQIASGLKYLHGKGIVHGDLTPTNVLINSDDKLCLADFGLSMVLAESGNPTFNSCHAGNVRWMAPEMFAIPEPGKLTKPTKPADVYSYGCIMLQLLCEKEPYFELVHVYHVMAAKWKGTEPFCQLTGVDDGREQYSLRCVSADLNARPRVQEIVAFIKAELKNLDI
ncbi:kinase-like domain-containing protein [Suillus clintonianus]|uniref:kinase-like domain-containing protein n=1 Tax=Suillus clintonianus TaxID=1904413 RepID=UPI001B878483|nr:kinase-like domain-containing protein [Suillus clintonianus]KAG2134504.1 kinase-like domain-containing protein [Suillus clintonianus]